MNADPTSRPAPAPLALLRLPEIEYGEALDLQRRLLEERRSGSRPDTLVLLSHPPVVTVGRGAREGHVLVPEPELRRRGIALWETDRGGDVTFHGPGQVVGYAIFDLRDHGQDLHRFLRAMEGAVIRALAAFGLEGARIPGLTGVWVRGRKVCAIGIKVSRWISMHGFALNVSTDLTYMREHIVACGIPDRPVTSLAEEGIDVTMRDVVDVVARLAAERWGNGTTSQHVERQDVAWRHRVDDLSLFSRGAGPGEPVRLVSRLAAAGVTSGLSIETRKPDWLRPKVHHGPQVLELKRTVRELDLVTVCEDAGCPNLSECWSDGTATFMVLGDRCTRACGFCLVDTRHPEPPAADEPERVAEAIDRMGLDHAVLTMVARDDLPDGGMGHVAACVEAIRRRRPWTRVETLVSDARGAEEALHALFAVRPDVFNHNVETVARLQRAVRPSAGYARSLSVLARAKAAGLTTKSGLIVGMGETDDEVVGCLADLAGIGVDIVTIGQYLRPTSHHLPVARWVEPDRFVGWAGVGEALGIGHVEASPLTRSSYHARRAADQVTPVTVGGMQP
jgi:lipoic acid synthetase